MGYKQKHPETCLAKCLMILIERSKKKRIPSSYELDLLLFSLKYERENIARGHLEKAAKDYSVSFTWYVDSSIFFNFVKKMNVAKQISLKQEKINLHFINTLLDAPLIIYIDRFYLWKKEWGLYYKYHYPHFVILNKRVGTAYEIIDPDDGQKRFVDAKVLSKAIIGLRNHLWISPQIIQLSTHFRGENRTIYK
ncbi:MAG: hypothetical protein H6502_00235 [Candidatus Woesearchaeota archaeon]|nr:MAG: hypothetical protein H6502_00235 [Candidatus Woesearchaeota archaeon]